MKKTFLVAMGSGDPAPWVKSFEKLLPEFNIAKLGDQVEPEHVNYAMTWYHPPGSLSVFTSLKSIFSMGAGVDHLFRDPQLPHVPTARVVDPDLTKRMTEYVVLHALSIMRQTRRYRLQQAQNLWSDDDYQPAAGDVRVGIMGMGVLGQDAAEKLSIMGFDVAGWSRSTKNIPSLKTFSGSTELPAFLARTDILVVLLPLTPDTRGIIDKMLLKGLARDGRVPAPSLINAGRGGLQKESDILECLDDGTLHEAVLDVFETEPLPVSSTLWAHPRVTITPHNASVSDPMAISRMIAEQVHRVERGEPLLYQVDQKRGY